MRYNIEYIVIVAFHLKQMSKRMRVHSNSAVLQSIPTFWEFVLYNYAEGSMRTLAD